MAKVNNELRRLLKGVRQRVAPSTSSGTFYPNGEFTIGRVSDYEPTSISDEYDYCQASPEDKAQDIDKTGWPLSLSNACNSHNGLEGPGKYGRNGITGYGRSMVKSGAFVLEDFYGASDLCFCTLTVPWMPQENRAQLARNWGEVGRHLVQYLSRALEKAARAPMIVGVTEIQPRRLQSSGEGYLHFHVVFPAHSNGDRRWAVEQPVLQQWWRNRLEKFSGYSGLDNPRVELKLVRKSAEGYLGKYMSKGSRELIDEFCQDVGEDSMPGQWWIMSSGLRTLLKSKTYKGRKVAELLENLISCNADEDGVNAFSYLQKIMITLDGMKFCIGIRGRIAREHLEEMQLLCEIGG